MHRLTEEQIEQLQEDIRQSGIQDDSLREDLLDHLCCHIEKGLEEGRDFEAAYAQALQQVCPDGMQQIQQETTREQPGRQRILKFMLYSTGFLSVFLVVLSTLLKVLHWPMAHSLVLLGWGLLFGGFVPLFISYKISEERPKSWFEKLTYTLGAASTAVVSTGIFFKFMHWPGANQLTIMGSLGFCLLFLPLLFFLLYRQAAKA